MKAGGRREKAKLKNKNTLKGAVCKIWSEFKVKTLKTGTKMTVLTFTVSSLASMLTS